MPDQTNPPLTQRAYTLRLKGAQKDDTSWRCALWQTHEAVNKGARVFGDWLLTLRGGLDHTLADASLKSGQEKPDSTLTDEERKARRILLALSWLSVESKTGAPENFIVASGQDSEKNRADCVISALKEILESRKVDKNELDAWINDCSASLSSAIRDDAVWVNRSKAFDEAVKSIGPSLTREEVWDILGCFFGSREAYLAPGQSSDEDESSEAEQEDKAKDLVQKAGQWLSSRFGTGKGANFSHMSKVYEKISGWADSAQAEMTSKEAINDLAAALSEFAPASNDSAGVLALIKGPGYKSATRNLLSRIALQTTVTQEDLTKLKELAAKDKVECATKIGAKGHRAYSDKILEDVESACGFTYLQQSEEESARHSEFAVMLDHAARRVSLAHTWIKRAEAERNKFEKDSKKINCLPEAVRTWFDNFCIDRSELSGALEPYRIRRRAIDGWEKVVAEWSKPSCGNCADRITAARMLQDDPDIGKFGDIQLFEALAEDDALCVWHKNGNINEASDPQLLIDYAAATEADFKKRKFKVPAYRHPDALLHPVFCDFGNSRWDIDFSIKKAFNDLDKQKALLNKKEEEIIRAKQKLNIKNSKDVESQKKLQQEKEKLKKIQQKIAWLEEKNGVEMALLNNGKIGKMALRWQSKRLTRDLALDQSDNDCGVSHDVSRADRLGRAASNATGGKVNILEIFNQDYWNGRLQAPRQQLQDIAAVRDNPSLQAAERERRMSIMKDRIQWIVTFSAKLRPKGPWCEFAELNQLNIDPKYYPHAKENRGRKGMAKLILCRLPGLRILSVDLGHRYAAACAVWEAVSADDVKLSCACAGHEEPNERELYLHLKEKKSVEQKNGGKTETEQTIIYRRIASDTLPDGTPHPAPWARLERQFLIRLQGEDEIVREASNEEIFNVHRAEAELGRTVPLIDRLDKAGWGKSRKQKERLDGLRKLGWERVSDGTAQDVPDTGEDYWAKPSLSVDELMSSALRTLCIALKRHSDRARIASAMTAEYKTMPGGRKYYFTGPRELSASDDKSTIDNKHIEFIQDALVLWHGLMTSRGWRDDVAKQLWNNHIAKLSGYKAPEEISDESSKTERKNKQKENREKLRGAAAALVSDTNLREALHAAWKKRWEEDDEMWRKRLRWFKDWILPRGKAAKDPAIRKVGGLSLARIATLTEFRRKVQVGFFTRLHPDGTKTEITEQFGQSALDALDRLREQRVKQLASRIAEAALGVGRVPRTKGGKTPKRPSARVDEPCHAIVIEDLTNYRPEETRTRRENRQLMSWSSSKVKKYLSEACQLYGLHLREVSAGYTSRQDSRTGAPGIRCQDVPLTEFILSPFWRKQVAQAEGKGDARDVLIRDLNHMLEDKSASDGEKPKVLRIPLKGGELFVSADKKSPASKGLQADLNAAANIGLRALTDPDWPGKWWYVPCEPGSFRPVKDKVEGSAAVDPKQALRQDAQPQDSDAAADKKKRAKKSTGKSQEKEIINLWRDISSSRPDDTAAGKWQTYDEYQNRVQYRVVDILREQANERKKRTSSRCDKP